MRLRKKILKITGSIIGLLTIIIIGVYFWVISHASSLLTKLVNDQSKGKLALTVKKVDFNLLKLKIVFTEPALRTKDSTDQITGYDISAKNIILKVESPFTFIFQKQLVVDSIIVNSPEISVYKYKEVTKEKISLPAEFSKIYQSLDSVLQKITLNYLHFDSTKFSIYDRTKPGIAPLQVSNLNLTINLASSKVKSAKEDRFLFADRILLEVFNQDLQFKEGLQGIKFKRLRLSTGSKSLKLDSCNLYGRKTDSTYGALDVSFDSINISNIDFNSLIKNNILKLDSALCINPHIKLQIAIKEKRTKESDAIQKLPADKDSIDAVIKKLLGNLDIGYLAVINASINIDSKQNNKMSTRSADKIDFEIKRLVIINDTAIPIQLGDVALAVRNYTAYKLDSLSTVKFDSIKLTNNKIRLANFSLTTTKDNLQLPNSTIKTSAFELTDINWLELIYEQQLKAGNASLINPEASLYLPDKNTSKPDSSKTKPPAILTLLKDKLHLKNFFIVDGIFSIKTAKGLSVDIEHCFADIKVTEFLKENSLRNMIDAVANLSFSKATFISNNMQLLAKDGSYSSATKSLKFAEVKQTKTDNSLAATFKNLVLDSININDGNNFSVSNLSWTKGDITINKKQKNTIKPVTDNTAYKVVVNHTFGGPTHFSYNAVNLSASTQINRLSVDEIIMEAGEKPVLTGLQIDGQPILVNQNKTESGIDIFNINDRNKSVLRNVTLRLPANEKIVKIFLPELVFSADINKSVNGLITADYIELKKPVISFESNKSTTESKPEAAKRKLPLIQIGTLKIIEPSIANLPENLADKMQISAGLSEFIIKGINSDGQAIRFDSVLGMLKNPGFSNSKISLVPTGNESIRLVASDFTFSPWAEGNSEKWAFTLNALHSSNFLMQTKKSDTIKQIITVKSLNVETLSLNSINAKSYKNLLRSNDRFLVTKGDFIIDNGKTIIAVNNLGVDRRANKLSVDSFSFRPAMDKESFISTKTFQTPPYIKVSTGNILISNIDYDQLINDTAFAVKKIYLTGCYLYLYKDRRLPFEYGIEKPMLTELIGKIKLKLDVDSLLLTNSRIEYDEINDKTLLLGKVKINEMRGNVTGVKNFNYAANDSLRFTVSSRIMDSARVKVKYVQSYTDSLAAFILQVNIRPFNLTALNPMLEPLVSARVRSGYLDTVSMIAIGRKYVAWGKMKMYYRDLDFQYLDKGSVVKKTFKTKMITFLGNLIVHKKNGKGTGDIYTERISEKGFPNYWIRILLSGALTNTGIRTNKKAEKKYYQAIKKFDVPPITEITID